MRQVNNLSKQYHVISENEKVGIKVQKANKLHQVTAKSKEGDINAHTQKNWMWEFKICHLLYGREMVMVITMMQKSINKVCTVDCQNAITICLVKMYSLNYKYLKGILLKQLPI